MPEPPSMRRRVPEWTRWLKLGSSVALLLLIAHFVQPARAFAILERLSPSAFVGACALLSLQPLVLAWRWRIVQTRTGHPVNWRTAAALSFVGLFFNQALPSAVGGDAMRVWLLRRRGTPLAAAFNGVALDRIDGVLTLVLLSSAGAFVINGAPYASLRWPGVLLACAAAAGVAALAILDRLPLVPASLRARIERQGLAAHTRSVFGGYAVLGASALSAASHLLVGSAAYLLARSLGFDMGFLPLLVLIGWVLLVTMLPFSIGGWGIREVGALYLLGRVAPSAEHALALSVSLGLALLAASLPGAAFWLASPLADRRPHAGAQLAGSTESAATDLILRGRAGP